MGHVATVDRSLFIPFLDQRDILSVRKKWISLRSVCRTNSSDFPLIVFVGTGLKGVHREKTSCVLRPMSRLRSSRS